jgi:hypothetical protein
MYSFANEDKNKIFQNLDAIREAFVFLMTSDQDFIDSIELFTGSSQAVTTRFDTYAPERHWNPAQGTSLL